MTKAMVRTLVSIGTLVGSMLVSAAVVRTDVPAPHAYADGSAVHNKAGVKGLDYVPPIDPSRVDCTAFRPASLRLCYKTANDLYQLFELIFDQLEANDFANAEQETLPTTPIVFPDGTVVHGMEEVGMIVGDFIGSNNFTLGPISNTFRYRPLDLNTVVVYGIVNFTIEDHQHQTGRILSNVQTELFRRNHQMPRGWEQVYEQHAYTQKLLGDQ